MHLAYYTDRLNRGVQEKFDDMLVKESMEYIDSHFQHASLTELADKLHQSQYSLSRLLKEKTGETFREMVLNLSLIHILFAEAMTRIFTNGSISKLFD